MEKTVLRDLSLSELDTWLATLREPPFRQRQIKSWLYAKGALDFDRMTDLSLDLRQKLSRIAVLTTATPVLSSRSETDGAVKQLFRMEDGETVEAVSMPGRNHHTFCISSQVGCPLDCVFCETGRWGFRRNLTQAEILDQIIQLRAALPAGSPSPNLVFMGMGEPLLNLSNLIGVLQILGHGDGLGFGGRRITVSTAGIPEGIVKLTRAPVKFGLALSLNAADDTLRAALMPGVARHPIELLLKLCEDFAHYKGNRVTLEYVLFPGINDRDQDAANLRRLTRGRPFKVNIIPYNPGDQTIRVTLPVTGESELQRPTPQLIERFVGRLLPQVPAVTVRWSQGLDVDGGCGQLRGRDLKAKGEEPSA